MNELLLKVAVTNSKENLTVFSLVDSTGKWVINLISELSVPRDIPSYKIDIMPTLVEWSEKAYNTEIFASLLQEYIEYLQKNEQKDKSFILIISRQPKIENSFYETIAKLMKGYADKITLNPINNTMMLRCE